LIFNFPVAAFLLQADVDLFVLLQDTGAVARIVLAILLIFSVWSWGIIFSKSLLLRRVRRETGTFWKIFRKGHSLSEIATACETLHFTPLVPVFNAGAELLQPRVKHSQGNLALAAAPTTLAALQRTIQRAASAQLTMLERRLSFLATTASVTPFVGLFGTVWGVLTSFTGLANTDTATLRAVAPGIAEALMTTAFGLLAAIPALVAYNHFVHEIRNLGGQLDDLQVEMLAIGERNGL
jgi:biopolymer transport protein TolQ